MAALVFALAVLMWMWGAAGLHLVRRYGRSTEAAIRMAYLVVVLAVGAVPLLALAYLVLPTSVLSQGWTREYLEATQQAVAAAVLATALAAFVRARHLLFPALAKGAPKPARKK